MGIMLSQLQIFKKGDTDPRGTTMDLLRTKCVNDLAAALT